MAPALRSKERVSENGEVFTPDHIVDKMNALIPDEVWKDPEYIFLEPTCGDGQFLVKILEKRIENGIPLEDACNTLFGMDIMYDNIIHSLTRVLEICKSQMLKEGMIHGTKEWEERAIRIMGIVFNNIYRVKDSLVEIREGDFDKKKFFDYDPTGKKCILSEQSRINAISKIKESKNNYVSGTKKGHSFITVFSVLFKREQ